MNGLDDGMITALTHEMLTVIDIAGLLVDPVFYGIGRARGDGKPVVVIPGFLGNDFYLQVLHKWLRCAGYMPIESSLNINAGCPERVTRQVLDHITSQLDGNSSSIALIGHSRGGGLAWALASHFQERVSHLVMLGAPVTSMMASVEAGKPVTTPVGPPARTLMRLSTTIRHAMDPDCDFPKCGCPFAANLIRPLSPSTQILSIYGRDDSFVSKESQITEGEILEVNTGHLGLVFHPAVYHALGRFLARDSRAHA
ncbi:MAG TPA: alpha/beta hydrolase [Candidatus Binataceae bacterium]|nr:alpha/beta hydrolase [Candidatus Binataceae bacterium]